jgi:hypothetical protein
VNGKDAAAIAKGAKKRKAETAEKRLEKDMDGTTLAEEGSSNTHEKELGHLYEIKESPGKGLGMFALRPIKSGTEIFREALLVQGVLVFQGCLSIEAGVATLSDEKKKAFMSLHSRCNCGKTPCLETPVMNLRRQQFPAFTG